MSAFAVIPVLDEAAAIGPLVEGLLEGAFAGVVVVDGGSCDGTPELARAAGATVVFERKRGYGRAMMTGTATAQTLGAEIITFLDGNGSVRPDQAAAVLEPAATGRADVVIGCREGAALRSLQRIGNRLAVEIIARAHGTRYDDVGSVRSVSVDALSRLGLDELSYGWPLQLQVRAAARGLRIEQVAIALSPRLSRSKVSGTMRGRVGATAAFLRVLASECVLAR